MGANWIWAKVKDEVQSTNQNAGTITLDSISDELKSALTNIEYNQWVAKSRLVLQEPQCPIILNNAIWRVVKRAELWQALGNRLFDQHLKSFKQLAINVLKERDPKFELPADDRFATSIYGKNLKYSESLRKGIAETLACLA